MRVAMSVWVAVILELGAIVLVGLAASPPLRQPSPPLPPVNPVDPREAETAAVPIVHFAKGSSTRVGARGPRRVPQLSGSIRKVEGRGG